MKSLLLVLLALQAGCASLNPHRTPTCDGARLRPANPHGSVLARPTPAAEAPPPQSQPSCP